LILALKAVGVGTGDEVITVSQTAVATVAAILAVGATPVFVDIEATYYTIDPALIEEAISSRCKAIIAVHLYGQAADLEAITEIARRRGLTLIEDCAQASGGRCRGRRLGSIGDVGCFSFYPTKNLGAIGDGGMIVTSDAKIATRVRRLRQYGWDEVRETHEAGLNSRLDPLQAAILCAKLPHLDADNMRRVAIAKRYESGLAGLPIATPRQRAGTQHVYHLYVVTSAQRDRMVAHLCDRQIGCAIHYPVPVHRQPGYAERAILPRRGLPVTDEICRQVLSLPMYPELSDDNIDEVVASICDANTKTPPNAPGFERVPSR
jgi:dTDP-4-amino-4,6-dideoxygalactose transaminase